MAKKHLDKRDRKVAIYSNTVVRVDQINESSVLEDYTIAKLIGAEGKAYKSFLVDAFCNPSSERQKRVLIATSCGDCGINCSSCTTVIHDGFPCNLLEFSQKMGRAGRSKIIYQHPPVECSFVISIEHFITLFARYQKIEKMEEREKHMDDLKSMMKLLIFPQKCIHKYLEDEFNECGDDGRCAVDLGPCGKCWYCSANSTDSHHPIRSLCKDHAIDVLERIFLGQNKNPVHATKLPKLINDHPKNHTIWGLTKKEKIPNSYAYSLVLALIAVDMFDTTMTEVKEENGKLTERMILTPALNDDGILWKSSSLWTKLLG